MSLSLLTFSIFNNNDHYTTKKLNTHYTIMNYCCTLIKDFSKDFNILLSKKSNEMQIHEHYKEV